MILLNRFDFIGRVVKEPTLRKTIHNKMKCNILLEIESHFNSNSNVEIMFYNDIAEIAAIRCKEGSIINVSGEVLSNSIINQEKGEITYEIKFIATELFVLQNKRKKRISENELKNIVDLYEPEEYKPPRIYKG